MLMVLIVKNACNLVVEMGLTVLKLNIGDHMIKKFEKH